MVRVFYLLTVHSRLSHNKLCDISVHLSLRAHLLVLLTDSEMGTKFKYWFIDKGPGGAKVQLDTIVTSAQCRGLLVVNGIADIIMAALSRHLLSTPERIISTHICCYMFRYTEKNLLDFVNNT